MRNLFQKCVFSLATNKYSRKLVWLNFDDSCTFFLTDPLDSYITAEFFFNSKHAKKTVCFLFEAKYNFFRWVTTQFVNLQLGWLLMGSFKHGPVTWHTYIHVWHWKHHFLWHSNPRLKFESLMTEQIIH